MGHGRPRASPRPRPSWPCRGLPGIPVPIRRAGSTPLTKQAGGPRGGMSPGDPGSRLCAVPEPPGGLGEAGARALPGRVTGAGAPTAGCTRARRAWLPLRSRHRQEPGSPGAPGAILGPTVGTQYAPPQGLGGPDAHLRTTGWWTPPRTAEHGAGSPGSPPGQAPREARQEAAGPPRGSPRCLGVCSSVRAPQGH